jgi:SAM-dependent methyltransferase
MKKSYLRYYENYSQRAPWRYKWDAVFTLSQTRRESIANRRRDYPLLEGNDSLRELHLDLNRDIYAQTAEWPSHDYGEGYFYQSLDEVSISGLRDTSARISALDIGDRVEGRSVLDIGSNSGFLALGLARTAKSVLGIEANPYLCNMATTTASFLKRDNASFQNLLFEAFETTDKFSAVLSLANHSTYDGNTAQTVEQYLMKCHSLLESEGLFVFESHAPAYEGDQLQGVLDLIDEKFNIIQRTTLKTGKRFDDGRTLLIANPR